MRLDEHVLRRVRSDVLRNHQHNLGTDAARAALADAAWRSVRQGDREVFLDAFDGSRDVDEFMATWWRQLDPRELLLTLADTEHVYAVSRGVLDQEEGAALAGSYREALELYYRHLAPNGFLSMTRLVQVPPRDGLKLLAATIAALEASGRTFGQDIDLVSKESHMLLQWLRPEVVTMREDIRLAGRELAKAVIARIEGIPPEELQTLSYPTPTGES